MRSAIIFSTLLAFAVSFTACDEQRFFDENAAIKDNNWSAADKKSFNFEISDTNQVYHVFLNVRNGGEYAFSNLYLFVTTHYPNGTSSKDTVNCMLQDENGKWMGEGLGDIWDNRILFKPMVRFTQIGKYSVDLEQAMRIDPLPMIMDVGLRIEKASSQQ